MYEISERVIFDTCSTDKENQPCQKQAVGHNGVTSFLNEHTYFHALDLQI